MINLALPELECEVRECGYIDASIQKYSESYSNFGNGQPPDRPIPSDLLEDCIPPPPSTLFTTILQIKTSVGDIQRQVRDFGREVDSVRAKVFGFLDSFCMDQLRVIKCGIMLDQSVHLPELQETVSQMNQDAALPRPRAKAQVAASWPRYAQLLASHLRPVSRPTGALKGLSEVNRHESVEASFSQISAGLGRLAEQFKAHSVALTGSSKQVDFTKDFREFVKRADFRFIDISPSPFDRFKFTSRYAVPDVINIERFTMPHLPLYIARVIADFTGEDRDELSVTTGQVIYLMQNPRDQWVFAMQRPFGICGFVPTNFVRIVGCGIAVVLKELVGHGRVGSIVAVIEEEKNRTVLVEDLKEKRFALPRDSLAIL
jgi:hypothetical protein